MESMLERKEVIKIKTLAKCRICQTKWYVGMFDQLKCPKCGGYDEAIITSAGRSLRNCRLDNYLCPVCFVTWKQDLDEKPKCPVCNG